MTAYLFVLAFMVFILGTVGPVLSVLAYEFALKKFGMFIDPKTNQVLRNPKLVKMAEVFTDCKPKKVLSRACFVFGLMSIVASATLILAVGFESDQIRDLGLFVGLWASTLFGLANYLKK
jgi:hypothetical protein